MKPVQLACYLMMASAFVLGAVLLMQADRHLQPQAHAEMVIDKGLFTVLSTPGNSNQEYTYVLNNRSSILVAYELTPSKNLEVVGTLDVGKAIQKIRQRLGTDSDSRTTR